jgi:hypothetical protein
LNLPAQQYDAHKTERFPRWLFFVSVGEFSSKRRAKCLGVTAIKVYSIYA